MVANKILHENGGEFPEVYMGMREFPADSSELVLVDHNGGSRILDFPMGDAWPLVRVTGQDIPDGREGWDQVLLLSRMYNEGPFGDFNLPDVTEDAALLGRKLSDLNLYLDSPHIKESPYWVVVDTSVDSEGDSRQISGATHQLARLVGVGMHQTGELFSVLEGGDGQTGLRIIKPSSDALGGLYR